MCYIANILVYSNLGVVVKTLDILASLTLKWRDISALSHETHETLSSGSPPHFLKGVHSVLLELSWFFAFLTAKMDPPVSDIVMSLHASSITITLSQVRGSKVSFFLSLCMCYWIISYHFYRPYPVLICTCIYAGDVSASLQS